MIGYDLLNAGRLPTSIHDLGPLYVQVEGRWLISGVWAFYWHAVYGVPPDIFADIVTEWSNRYV